VYQFEKIYVSLSLSKAVYQYDQLRHPDSYRDSLTGFVVQYFQPDTVPEFAVALICSEYLVGLLRLTFYQ
jgi:Cu2+-containing amine oxidase